MVSSREEVTRLIIASKVRKGLKWQQVAEVVGLSKEFVTAGFLSTASVRKGSRARAPSHPGRVLLRFEENPGFDVGGSPVWL